ncbi:MAG TPA: hypothetical protein VF905_14560, partial [Nitrospirota bacterium]
MKLEIKVQVPGSSPRDAEFETSCPFRSSPGAVTAARKASGRELSAEIEFYPSYALVKERSDLSQKLVSCWDLTDSNRLASAPPDLPRRGT